jgi:hypothetical protein
MVVLMGFMTVPQGLSAALWQNPYGSKKNGIKWALGRAYRHQGAIMLNLLR